VQNRKPPRGGPPRHDTAPSHHTPVVLALGAVLSGSALIAQANSMMTINSSTTSSVTLSSGADIWFQSTGTIDTASLPALVISTGDTNATVSLSAGASVSSGLGYGVENQGQLNQITNNGTISGGTAAIYNNGAINQITNSGLISASIAINSTGSFGIISNSGTIAGAIVNTSSDALTLMGGTGAVYGTFTGLSGMGSITNPNSNLVLANGNVLMNDNINVGTNTVNNTGATLLYDRSASVTGNYSQSAGTLDLSAGATLSVSGTASIRGGTISSTLQSYANYLAGETITVLSAGTLVMSGGVDTVSRPTGIDVDWQSSGSALSLEFNADYIGSSLASTAVTGTISSAYGAYIAASGSLGTLSVASNGLLAGSLYAIENLGSLGTINNAGTITGNIDLGSSVVTIVGASGTQTGSLTGGTLSASAGQLYLQGGNLLLDDNVTLASGTGTLTSGGGTLQLDSPHTLSGNYAQLASETLLIGVADNAVATGSASTDSGYGRLIVSGSASIAAGSSIALTKTGSSYRFATGQRYVVMVANSSGTQYNASSLNVSAQGYGGTISGAAVADGSNSDLVLTLSSGGSSTPDNLASQYNPHQALAGLFDYSGTQSALLNLYNAAAAIGSSSEANTAGAQLSPVGTAVANSQVSMAVNGAATDVVRNRLDQLRGGGSGLSSGDDTLDHSVWGQLFGGTIQQGDRDGVSGYRASYAGMMVGADAPLNDRWTTGIALSFSNSTQSASGANSGNWVHSHAYGAHGYAGYDAGRWYLNLDASVDRLEYSSLRQVDFSGFTGDALGQFHGLQYSTSAEAGWPIKLSGWRDTVLTPSLTLAYTHLDQSAYTESGGNGAALAVNGVSDSSMTSLLGVRLERGFLTQWGLLTPYTQLGWRHEYIDSRLQTTASFAADSSGATGFTSVGATPLRDSAVLALGATLVKTQRLSFSGRLQFDSGASYAAESVELTMRYRF